jgi:hypothetical protein
VSMAEIEKQRLARRKGEIIRILREEYVRNMTSAASLLGTLDNLGHSISLESLQFDLTYLAEQGYIQIWRVRDLPGFRSDRVNIAPPDQIRFAKLLARGLQLLDGNVKEDPQVIF